jgi:hypothetical protein
MIRWLLSLTGLALVVFAVAALTGPGRIDIDDGQARFEAGRGWIETGRPIVTDPRVYWHVLPGCGGENYTYYRAPSEAAAAVSVAVADATGAKAEGRRHFVYSLHGAVAAALLVVVFAVAFRAQGLSDRAALGWAASGFFCSPCWFYATSTFDDLLGTLAVIVAITAAGKARSGGIIVLGIATISLVIAVNCKPPLAAFVLPCLAAADDPRRSRPLRWSRALLLVAAVLLGHITQKAYHAWKFPPESAAAYEAALLEKSFPMFFGNVPEALLDLSVGPSSGALWYFPPIVLALAGLSAAMRSSQRRLALATAAAVAAFTLFVALLTFYKGGVCWGPRYLTPVFAVLWLFAPLGATRLARGAVILLLAAGALVQILGLAMVPERLYVERDLHSSFFLVDPWLNLRPELGHLANRPREIHDALTAPPSPHFTPSPSPTFTLPVFDPPAYTGPKGIAGVRSYTLLNGLRPWWASFPALPQAERPINVARTAWLFGAVGLISLFILIVNLPPRASEPSP